MHFELSGVQSATRTQSTSSTSSSRSCSLGSTRRCRKTCSQKMQKAVWKTRRHSLVRATTNSVPLCAAFRNGNFGAPLGKTRLALVCLFVFRLSATRATVVAILCTLSETFDVPVYWPILLVYFFVLFALTMRRQIQCVCRSLPFFFVFTCCRHMVKYKYVPFDIGRKARYGGQK